MKKVKSVIICIFIIFALSACNNNDVNFSDNISPIPDYSDKPTPTSTPTTVPIPESYLTFEQAQNKEGYFIKHKDYYIDLLKYQNNYSTENFIIYPVHSNSIDTEMLEFDNDTDKIVYFSHTDKIKNAEITPAAFYGYTLPIEFSNSINGYYINNSDFPEFKECKIQSVNNTPLTGDILVDDAYYITDYENSVNIGGFKGTEYIESSVLATANCYEINNRIIEGQKRYDSGRGVSQATERESLEFSKVLTTNGYMEIVFENPLEEGIYVFSTSETGRKADRRDVIFQVK